MTEMVDHPDEGRLFEATRSVGFAEVGPSGRARLNAIAGWLQDVAWADLVDAGLGEEGAWIVRRSRIVVDRFPSFGETVTLQTFCSATAKLWAERRTSLRGEAGAAVEAATLWVHLERDSGRPRRLSEGFREIFAPSAANRGVKARLCHPSPPHEAAARPWRFRAADLDLAGHVNNAAYWEVLEEELPQDRPLGPIDSEIEFSAPAGPGEARIAQGDSHRWILGSDRELHASVAFGGWACGR